MNRKIAYIILMFAFTVLRTSAQPDLDPPVAPVLQLVSVDQVSGNVEIEWSLSPSPDVSGYVIYLYRDGEGYELDTIYDPSATNYLRTGSGSVYYSESFVVSALDTAGNISPLSNMLSTIFASVQIDTCNKRLEVKWNSYSSVPKELMEYCLYLSVNGGSFSDSIKIQAGTTVATFEDFSVDAQYCFFVRASLSGGLHSGSNRTCIFTGMQRPPEWINADYATVDQQNGIVLSFTIDPMSEISNYSLERKTGSNGQFGEIRRFTGLTGRILYNDNGADVNKLNYYRLNAINNCNKAVTVSNVASNIVLAVERSDEEIKLSWNPYRSWRGIITNNKIFINTGSGLEERQTLLSADSAITIRYSDLMYEARLKDICFMIMAIEGSNPYVPGSESRSQVVCTPVTERITVPNLFIPAGSSENRLFKPVLSFTPVSYRLLITDMKRKTVFETSDFLDSWDGMVNGVLQPEGVYLWFLEARILSGKTITRTGTVTIVYNH